MPKIDASRLPERPDLAHERKRAKELFRALRRYDHEAVARLRTHHPRFADFDDRQACSGRPEAQAMHNW